MAGNINHSREVDRVTVRDRALLGGNEDMNWKIWNINDIYRGIQSERELHHVQVGDMVVDLTGGVERRYYVKSIDDSTRIPELVLLRQLKEDSNTVQVEMKGVGPGQASETWRCFFDDTIEPHSLRVDGKVYCHGSLATHCKIFLGVETDKYNGKVISQYRDNNSDRISENIPLELVGWRDNQAIKTPMMGFTTHKLQDGEVVTMVTYSADGVVFQQDRLIVVNTADVRRSEVGKKFVEGIEIVTPFLSEVDDREVLFPINMDREAVFIMCRVNYSDGTSKTLAVDGGRVQLHGMDSYIPSVLGAGSPLVLQYQLAENEESTQALRGTNRFLSESYVARTKEVDGAYSVRLSVLPFWNGTEWELHYRLHNLDRNISYDVSDVVEAASNSMPFQPRKFGTMQRVVVALQLDKVSSSFARFRHVQSFDISLMGSASIDTSPFYISYHTGQDPYYGQDVKIVKSQVGDRHYINISCGATTLEDWLDKLYYRTEPLFNKFAETQAPKPTHFMLVGPGLNEEENTFSVDNWRGQNETPIEIPSNTVVEVQWIRKDGDQVMYLTSSPVVVKAS